VKTRKPSTLRGRIRPTRFGEMLRLYRTVYQMSLRDLAPQIGTSPATLMRIEAGEAFDVATGLKLMTWLLGEAPLSKEPSR
jgi:transcriptional regulator with XRE-family HTH domain